MLPIGLDLPLKKGLDYVKINFFRLKTFKFLSIIPKY